MQVFFLMSISCGVCVCAHVFAVRHHESNYPPENYLSFELLVNLPLLTYPCQKHEGFNKALSEIMETSGFHKPLIIRPAFLRGIFVRAGQVD